MKRALILLLALTLYCNIAWVVGSYYYYNVTTINAENLTTLGKIAAGGWSCLSFNAKLQGNAFEDAVVSVIYFGIVWPIGIFFGCICTWITYGCFYGCFYAGWFIFAGGAAKLIGL
jgi:hypothetical protein